MKKWNKLLALLLAMVMAFGMTVTAFAEEAKEPVEGTTTTEEETTPAEDTTTPAEGEDAAAPAEGEDAAAPAEGEDAAAPAEGEDAAAEAGYTDVTEANWFYEAVTYVTEKGLVDGETETTFAPNASMTRADLVTALYRLAGSPEVTAENPFTDVAADAEYYNAVMWAYTNGVVGGITDTTYEPDSPLQRQQVATMLYRYMNDSAEEETAEPTEETVPMEELTPAEPMEETTTETTEETVPAEELTPAEPVEETTEETTTETTEETVPAEELTPAEPVEETTEETTTETTEETVPMEELTPAEPVEETTEADETLAQFTDADQIQDYAKEAMAWAVTVGLFGGDDKGALDPRGDITRAEVATLIMRFVELTTVETPEDAIGGADAETEITVTEGEDAAAPAEDEKA